MSTTIKGEFPSSKPKAKTAGIVNYKIAKDRPDWEMSVSKKGEKGWTIARENKHEVILQLPEEKAAQHRKEHWDRDAANRGVLNKTSGRDDIAATVEVEMLPVDFDAPAAIDG